MADAGSSPAATDQIQVGLYYVGTDSLNHFVATRSVLASDLNQTSMIDIPVTSSVLLAGDPAIGKQINVGFIPLSNSGGQFDIDNVRVVPEPASLGLLGVGIGSLLARRRRR